MTDNLSAANVPEGLAIGWSSSKGHQAASHTSFSFEGPGIFRNLTGASCYALKIVSSVICVLSRSSKKRLADNSSADKWSLHSRRVEFSKRSIIQKYESLLSRCIFVGLPRMTVGTYEKRSIERSRRSVAALSDFFAFLVLYDQSKAVKQARGLHRACEHSAST